MSDLKDWKCSSLLLGHDVFIEHSTLGSPESEFAFGQGKERLVYISAKEALEVAIWIIKSINTETALYGKSRIKRSKNAKKLK